MEQNYVTVTPCILNVVVDVRMCKSLLQLQIQREFLCVSAYAKTVNIRPEFSQFTVNCEIINQSINLF